MVESSRANSLLCSSWLFSLFFISATVGVCQEVQMIHQPSRLAPFVVVIKEAHRADFILEHMRAYEKGQGASFLIVSVDQEPVDHIVDSVNHIINYTDGIDLQRCFLLVVGGHDFFRKVEPINTTRFFSRSYYLSTDDITSFSTTDYEVGGAATTRLSEVMDAFSGHYLWRIQLGEIQKQYVSDLNQNAIESGIGIRVNGVIPFYDGIETGIKPFFRTLSLNSYHRWGRRWQSNLDATIGLNVPSQNRIQNELQSVGLSDEDVEVTIYAHVLASVGLETRYLFMPESRKLNPFVGIRLGVSSIDATEATIEVDAEDVSSGNFDRPDGFDADDFESIRSPIVGISSGLQLNVSPKLMIETSIRWSNDLRNITEVAEPYFNNLSLSIGFNLRFTGKKKLFYDYLSLSNE